MIKVDELATNTGETLDKIPDRSRHVLLIGDSISNGYGIEGKDQSCTFSAQTQNQWLTYAALAARELGADLVTLAISGRGLVKNYAGNDPTMLTLMDRIIPTEPKQVINDTYKPDIVIVHLGTNDFSGSPSPKLSRFIPTYRNLLNRLHEQFPAARIYGAIGPMLQDHEYRPARDAIKAAIDQHNSGIQETSAYKAEFIEFRSQAYNKFGCDWHPNTRAHEAMADALLQRIQEDLDWQPIR